MIRRLRLPWPDTAKGVPEDRPVRLLAVSDERVTSFDHARNRVQVGPLDAVIGCGDLEPDYLAFLADAFRAPLLYVRGNHDRGAGWMAGRHLLPQPLGRRVERLAGVSFVGLSWPSARRGRAIRDDAAAWAQSLRAAARGWLRGGQPFVIVSHVPPSGLGDVAADPYHRGFGGYHWLCRTLRPPLWLHGHTATASTDRWRTQWGTTTLVNATGAVLIELGGSATVDGGTIAQPVTGDPDAATDTDAATGDTAAGIHAPAHEATDIGVATGSGTAKGVS